MSAPGSRGAPRGRGRGRGRRGSPPFRASNSDVQQERHSQWTRASQKTYGLPSRPSNLRNGTPKNGRGSSAFRGSYDSQRKPLPSTMNSAPGSSWRDPTADGNTTYQKRMGELFQTLKTQRERERKDAIRNGVLADPDKPTSLAHAITPVGTCQDMCPEYERVERIVQLMVDGCEKTRVASSDSRVPCEDIMVKRFRRSAAGYDEQLPSDIRPPPILQKSLNYLFDEVIGGAESLATVHKFVWDRTRGIRNDFSIQQVTKIEDVRIAIDCFERIARFHILSLHQLSRPGRDSGEFDHHQEREQLNNTLLSLMYYYDDSRSKVSSPHEAEFRAYCIIFEMQDQRPDLEDRAQNWPKRLLKDPRVQNAMKLYAAAANTSDDQGPLRPRTAFTIAQANYGRFWSIVASHAVSYLMACAAEIYFNMVRKMALETIWKAYRRGKSAKIEDWTLADMVTALGFDNEDQTQAFCEQHGFVIGERENGESYVDLGSVSGKWLTDSTPRRKQVFSENLVEPKRLGRTLPAIINGLNASQARREGLMSDSSDIDNSISSDPAEESLFVPEDQDSDAQQGNTLQNQQPIKASDAPTFDPLAKPFKPVSSINRPQSTNSFLSTTPMTTSPFPPSRPGFSDKSDSIPGETSLFGTSSQSNGSSLTNTAFLMSKTPKFDLFKPLPPQTSTSGASPTTSITNPFQSNSIFSKPATLTNPTSNGLGPFPNFRTSTDTSIFGKPSTFEAKEQSGDISKQRQETVPKPPPFSFLMTSAPSGPPISDSESSQSPPVFPQPPPPNPSILELFPTKNESTNPRPSLPISGQSSSVFTTRSEIFKSTPVQAPSPLPEFRPGAFPFQSNSSETSPPPSTKEVQPQEPLSVLSPLNQINPQHSSPFLTETPSSFFSPSFDRQFTPIPRTEQTKIGPPRSDPKPEALELVSKALVLADEGLLQQFIEYTMGPLITEAIGQVKDEQSWAKAARIRELILGKKYFRRWKEVAWRLNLLRKGRERRKNFARSMHDLKESTQRAKRESRQSSALDNSQVQNDEVRGFLQQQQNKQQIMLPPPKPASEQKKRKDSPETNGHRSPSDESNPKRIRSGSVLSTQRMISQHSRANHRLSKSIASSRHLSRSRGSRSSSLDLAPLRLSNGSVLTDDVIARARRLVTVGRTNTTRTDYFQLKAMGIDPDTPVVPATSRKRLREEEDLLKQKAAKLSSFNPPKSPSRSGEASASGANLTNHGNSSQTIRNVKNDEDEDLFAQMRQVREAMSESISWFKEEREKSEMSKSSSRSHDYEGETEKQRRLRLFKPTPSRTEQRLKATGAHGLLPKNWKPSVERAQEQELTDLEVDMDVNKEEGQEEEEEEEDDDDETGEEEVDEDEDYESGDEEEGEEEDGNNDNHHHHHPRGLAALTHGFRDAAAQQKSSGGAGTSAEDAIEL